MVKRHTRANLNKAYFEGTIRDVENIFHCNFQTGFTAHPTRYKGVNLGLITLEEIKDRPICVQVKILYIARLQEPNTS
jgi:hypothetical protein